MSFRIFQVGTRVFSDGQVGGFASNGMTYPDFIFFMLSEEDKASESAIKYWSFPTLFFPFYIFSEMNQYFAGSLAVIWTATEC